MATPSRDGCRSGDVFNFGPRDLGHLDARQTHTRLMSNGDSAYSTGTADVHHDLDAEDASYARSLLTAEERAELDAEIEKSGYLDIDNVRLIIQQNTPDRGLVLGLDPQLLLQLDARTNYRIFIADGDVYTRSELLESYPFVEFGATPESVFVRQEVGVFADGDGGYDFMSRDEGETAPFELVEDVVRRAVHKRAQFKQREPVKVVKTKTFVAREGWDDFLKMSQFVRGFTRFVACPMLENGAAPSTGDAVKVLAEMFFGAVPGGRKLLAAPEPEAVPAKAQTIPHEKAPRQPRAKALVRLPKKAATVRRPTVPEPEVSMDDLNDLLAGLE